MVGGSTEKAFFYQVCKIVISEPLSRGLLHLCPYFTIGLPALYCMFTGSLVV